MDLGVKKAGLRVEPHAFAGLPLDFNVGGFMGWVTRLFIKGSGWGTLGDISVGVIGAFLGGALVPPSGY